MENGIKEMSLEEMKTVNGGWTLIGGRRGRNCRRTNSHPCTKERLMQSGPR